MTWATVVFVSKRGPWIVAQEYDEWIVFELVVGEGSIQILTKLGEGGTRKAAVKSRLLSAPAALLILTSRAGSLLSEPRSKKANSGAVMITREAPAHGFGAVAPAVCVWWFRTDSVFNRTFYWE